jgi:regulatory protein
MRITDISLQAKNPNRVNISVDGKYRFSLDVFQVGELGIKRNNDYSEAEIVGFETESQFGKLYARTLEYAMLRPRSVKEIRDYLWKKTLTTKYKSRKTGEIKDKPGISKEITERVLERVQQKGYVNDEQFTRWWVENRNQTKGSSLRKLRSELQSKGVASAVVDAALLASTRSDEDELKKIIAKKAKRYDDEQKLMQYLARQGFSYDDIKRALMPDQ